MKETPKIINGFSKRNPREKLELVAEQYAKPEEALEGYLKFHNHDPKMQKLLEEFSENTITNFPMPFCACPNMLINGKAYMVPMVIEESSVVAAAASSAKYWFKRGGFHTELINNEKIGQVHFIWRGNKDFLRAKFPELKERLIKDCFEITENMVRRGGGITDIELRDLSKQEDKLLQLHATFDTVDSMGANFINSCLEQFAKTFTAWCNEQPEYHEGDLEIIMCILSNLTPNCRVKCWVEAPIKDLDNILPGMSGEVFARKFWNGVRVAEVDPHRSVTHNKGIMNGVDAVILATGNDFRAVEACCHAYASKDGRYTSLSHVDIDNGIFKFYTELPFALGVVGGLTQLHPLVKLSLELLGQPSATELMGIAAATGLANNFSAVKNLVTVGIQQGHMKMHLLNILKQLKVAEDHHKEIVAYFKDKVVSVSAVRNLAEKWHLIPEETSGNGVQ